MVSFTGCSSKNAELAPAGIVTLAGTITSLTSLEFSVMTNGCETVPGSVTDITPASGDSPSLTLLRVLCRLIRRCSLSSTSTVPLPGAEPARVAVTVTLSVPSMLTLLIGCT